MGNTMLTDDKTNSSPLGQALSERIHTMRKERNAYPELMIGIPLVIEDSRISKAVKKNPEKTTNQTNKMTSFNSVNGA